MATKESLMLRAARLRSSLAQMEDPIARILLQALIEALEEAAAEKSFRVNQKSNASLRLVPGRRASS
jgi:hypothetical protein